jgi:glutathione S-transferase
VLWLLEEIGAPYDLTLVGREERQAEEHRARHPLGRVPVVEEDGGFVFESAAILLHVADLHPEANLTAPVGSHERALVYQWTLFAMTELEVEIIKFASAQESDPERAATAKERFQAAAQVIENALAGHEYLVGDRFTVADLACGAVLIFGKRFELIEGMPVVDAYIERLEARPARERAQAIGV